MPPLRRMMLCEPAPSASQTKAHSLKPKLMGATWARAPLRCKGALPAFLLLPVRLGHLVAMSYKIDLHCHSWFSGDGVSSPEAMIATAKRKGLHGFALTDHNTSDGCRYLLDKGLVREDGRAVDDFVIIPGVEVTTAEGHLLCLGVVLPFLKGTPAAEVCQMVHELGGVAIPPHPYDLFRAGIRQSVLDSLEIDALEVFNAATTLKRYNKM